VPRSGFRSVLIKPNKQCCQIWFVIDKVGGTFLVKVGGRQTEHEEVEEVATSCQGPRENVRLIKGGPFVRVRGTITIRDVHLVACIERSILVEEVETEKLLRRTFEELIPVGIRFEHTK
jgi:hypothetical protein